MKYNFTFSHAIKLMLVLSLCACAQLPKQVIIAPEIIGTPTISYNNKQAQLNVMDMRTANHVVQILREGKAATLLTPHEKLTDTIKNNLTKHWEKQGLAIPNSATNTINITIEKAVISIIQETMKYKAQTEIQLTVVINNGDETLTSTFKNNGNSNGPLNADIAVVERNFNQRLAQLLQQILANEKIANFLK